MPPKVSLGDESFHWLRATASPLLITKLSQAELGQGWIGQGEGMQKQADLRATAETAKVQLTSSLTF